MDQDLIRELQARAERLERRLRLMQVVWLAGAAVLLAIVAAAWRPGTTLAEGPPPVLRVRGLIVEDAQGRERILLGAPVPRVPGPRREDPATALVFLGERGADRVAVGLVPGPQMGGRVNRRISQLAGIQIDDGNGDERGGFGIMDNGTISLGMDHPNQHEGVFAAIVPSMGISGFLIMPPEGKDSPRAELLLTKEGKSLLRLGDSTPTPRVELSVTGTSAPVLEVRDAKGKLLRNALGIAAPE